MVIIIILSYLFMFDRFMTKDIVCSNKIINNSSSSGSTIYDLHTVDKDITNNQYIEILCYTSVLIRTRGYI